MNYILTSHVRKQLNSRKRFLEERLAEERATLDDVMAEVGHPYHEAVDARIND